MFDFDDSDGLENSLYAAIHIFEDSRDRWHARHSDYQLFKALDNFGGSIAQCMRSLVLQADLKAFFHSGPKLREAISGPGIVHTVIRDRLEIEFAFEFCTDVEGRAQRSLELLELVLSHAPSHNVQRYLRHLTRCYIDGAYPECVMLCRAVLENAVRDRFEQSNIPTPATASGHSSMSSRLVFAQKARWLTPNQARDANTIWLRGNKAIHDDPEATTDILGTIRMTISVLQALLSPSPG